MKNFKTFINESEDKKDKILSYLTDRCGWFNDYDESMTGVKTKKHGTIYINLKTPGIAKFIVGGYTSPRTLQYGNVSYDVAAEEIDQFVSEVF